MKNTTWKFNSKSKYKEILDIAKEEKRAPIHSFHRYYGKLIPAIPRAFIREFTKENDIIGDLFCGSGTVAVETKLAKRNFVGCEINPLSHLISTVKTSNLDVRKIEHLNDLIIKKIYEQDKNVNITFPYCINRDHWFKQEVQRDLVFIKKAVDSIISKICNLNEQQAYKNFYYASISAIIRNVSNADPGTVFPGISIRIRKLEAEGKIHKNAIKTFENAIKKRAKYFNTYTDKKNKIDIKLGDSLKVNLNKYKSKVSLFVTNPPYISSVRYIETMKLEMYWLEYIKNSIEYGDLANKMLGNDKVRKDEFNKRISSKYKNINEIIEVIKKKSLKDSYIVGKYFNDMEQIIKKMNYLLKIGGKVVVKISDSNVKKTKVETGKYLTEIALNNGFKLVDVFLDKINANSRSLTTARNTYSDIILNDNIIIWEKVSDK